MTVVDDARALLQDRLAAIEEEAGQIHRALEHMSPDAPRKAPSKSRTVPRRGPGGKGKRAKRGQRQQQLLDSIKKMKGASPNELADAIGISATQVHGMARKLEAKGQIKKKGQGFGLVG